MTESRFKKILAFIFSFLFFVSVFNNNVHAVGNINVLIVGGRGVGKSTLLHRLVTQNFENPITEDEVMSRNYEHGKIYFCETDVRIKIVEMDIQDKDLSEEYANYLYQNANIIIHMSHVRDLPDKQAVSNWYDEFVRTILKGQKEAENWELLGSIFGDSNDVDGYESSIKNFRADPESVSHRRVWFGPLQLKCKIGYIIFVFNGSDSPNVFDNCQELWDFVGDFPNSRSILYFDSLSSNGEGTTIYGVQKNLVTLNEWVHSTSTLSSFEPYDENMINRYMPSPRAYTVEDIHEQLKANEDMNPLLKWTLRLVGAFGIGTTAIYSANRINFYRKNKEEQAKEQTRARRRQYLNSIVESNIRKNQENQAAS